VALRQMLENAEAELANAQLRPPEKERSVAALN
jgi:hypothetical protein